MVSSPMVLVVSQFMNQIVRQVVSQFVINGIDSVMISKKADWIIISLTNYTSSQEINLSTSKVGNQ